MTGEDWPTPDTCVICRRNEPTEGRACTACRISISLHLERLLNRLVELPLHLAPSAAPRGERVTTSRAGAPAPARMDILSLLGHGAAVAGDLAAQRPLVRRWCTTRQVDVTQRGAPRSTVVITEWHQELIRDAETGDPVLVADDDQTGLVPPREWLGQQVDTWRAAFGHHRPPPVQVPPATPPVTPLTGAVLLWMNRYAPRPLVVDACRSRIVADAYGAGRAQLITGMSPGFNGRRPAGAREDDPLADEWRVRFGEPAVARAPAENVRYLATWLDEACETSDLDLRQFVVELRALNAELGRALGEKPDQTYLGRCPSTVTDRATNASGPCGAAIWQEPFSSVVTCPRCRSTHGPRVVDLIRLAQDIRRVWPLDRRKRYDLAETNQFPDVLCPACGQTVYVYWRDVTGTDEGWQTWFVPAGVMCPGGCAEALEVLR